MPRIWVISQNGDSGVYLPTYYCTRFVAWQPRAWPLVLRHIFSQCTLRVIFHQKHFQLLLRATGVTHLVYFFSWSLFHIISCGMKTANLNSNNTAYPIFLWVATLCYSFLYQSGNILPTNPNIFNRLFVFLYYISIINTLLQKVFSHIWKTMTSISFSILYTIYTK